MSYYYYAITNKQNITLKKVNSVLLCISLAVKFVMFKPLKQRLFYIYFSDMKNSVPYIYRIGGKNTEKSFKLKLLYNKYSMYLLNLNQYKCQSKYHDLVDL